MQQAVLRFNPHGSLSLYQMAQLAAKRAIQNNIEFLQGYDEIVLFFDNDDAGRKAAADAASVLPPGKVKLSILSNYKDASECLQAGDVESLTPVPFGTPKNIAQMESLMENSQESSTNTQSILMTDSTPTKVSTTWFMVSDTESLLPLLQAVESENPHSAGKLQLHFTRWGQGRLCGS